MALKTDNDTLTKELKAGAKVGRNFIFSPGAKPEDSYLALSKKKIPPAEHKAAKKASKKPIVFFGSCFKDGADYVFETPLKCSPAVTLKLKKCIKEKSGYPSAKAVLRQNTGWVEAEFEDEGKAEPEKEEGPGLAELKREFEDAQAKFGAALTALGPLVAPDVLAGWTNRQSQILAQGQKAMTALDLAALPPLLDAFKAMVTEATEQLTRVKDEKSAYDAAAGELPTLRKQLLAVTKGKHPDAADLGKLLKQIEAFEKARNWKDATTAIAQLKLNLAPALAAVKKKLEFDAALKKDLALLQKGLGHDPGPFLLLKKLLKDYKASVAALNAATAKYDYTAALAALKKAVPQATRLVELDKDYAAYAKFKKANKADFDFLEKLNNSCPPNVIWKDEMNAYWGLLRKYHASDFKGALADLKKVVKKVAALKVKVTEYDKKAGKKADKATTDLKALVKGKSFTFPDTPQGKKDAKKLVKKLSDEVGKLKPEKQLELLEDLHGPTAKLTPEQRIMQRALYMKIKMDKSFAKADGKLRDAYQNALKKDKQLQEAVGDWGKKNKDGTPVVDESKKKAAIERVLKAQCASLKIPVPPIDWFYENSGSCGSFSQNTGVMRLNTKLLSDMGEMIDTVLHENTHNFQDQLCKRYINGEIKPTDPLYKQAKAFAALHHMDAYVSPSEDYDCYKKQPEEDHAWDAGNKESKRLTANLKKARRERLKAEAKKKKKK